MDDRTLGYAAMGDHTRLSRLAIMSFVLGCLSPAIYCAAMAYTLLAYGYGFDGPPIPWYIDVPVTAMVVLPPVIATLTGAMALRAIRRSRGALRGKPMAWIGLAIGATVTVFFVVIFLDEMLK